MSEVVLYLTLERNYSTLERRERAFFFCIALKP